MSNTNSSFVERPIGKYASITYNHEEKVNYYLQQKRQADFLLEQSLTRRNHAVDAVEREVCSELVRSAQQNIKIMNGLIHAEKDHFMNYAEYEYDQEKSRINVRSENSSEVAKIVAFEKGKNKINRHNDGNYSLDRGRKPKYISKEDNFRATMSKFADSNFNWTHHLYLLESYATNSIMDVWASRQPEPYSLLKSETEGEYFDYTMAFCLSGAGYSKVAKNSFRHESYTYDKQRGPRGTIKHTWALPNTISKVWLWYNYRQQYLTMIAQKGISRKLTVTFLCDYIIIGILRTSFSSYNFSTFCEMFKYYSYLKSSQNLMVLDVLRQGDFDMLYLLHKLDRAIDIAWNECTKHINFLDDNYFVDNEVFRLVTVVFYMIGMKDINIGYLEESFNLFFGGEPGEQYSKNIPKELFPTFKCEHDLSILAKLNMYTNTVHGTFASWYNSGSWRDKLEHRIEIRDGKEIEILNSTLMGIFFNTKKGKDSILEYCLTSLSESLKLSMEVFNVKLQSSDRFKFIIDHQAESILDFRDVMAGESSFSRVTLFKVEKEKPKLIIINNNNSNSTQQVAMNTSSAGLKVIENKKESANKKNYYDVNDLDRFDWTSAQ